MLMRALVVKISSYDERRFFWAGWISSIGAESEGRVTLGNDSSYSLSLSKTIDSGAGVINYSTTYSNQPSKDRDQLHGLSDYGYDYKHTFSQTCSVGEME